MLENFESNGEKAWVKDLPGGWSLILQDGYLPFYRNVVPFNLPGGITDADLRIEVNDASISRIGFLFLDKNSSLIGEAQFLFSKEGLLMGQSGFDDTLIEPFKAKLGSLAFHMLTLTGSLSTMTSMRLRNAFLSLKELTLTNPDPSGQQYIN